MSNIIRTIMPVPFYYRMVSIPIEGHFGDWSSPNVIVDTFGNRLVRFVPNPHGRKATLTVHDLCHQRLTYLPRPDIVHCSYYQDPSEIGAE
jgi:hypothetical protein